MTSFFTQSENLIFMALSFEFFPPRTKESAINLKKVRRSLARLHPEYFSITFGAGGRTQVLTLETVLAIQSEKQTAVAAHISCMNTSLATLEQLLINYQQQQIRRLVVLRGDLPASKENSGAFHYAYQLIEFIRQRFNNYFHISVAAYPEKHPESNSAHKDIIHFVNKMKAGADEAITQYFYNIDAYFYFVEQVQKFGIDIAIIPGIMPITNYIQLSRFSQISGAEIPKWIANRLYDYRDNLDDLKKFGIEVVGNLCQQLKMAGVNDFHFYTMNKSEPSKLLAQALLNLKANPYP